MHTMAFLTSLLPVRKMASLAFLMDAREKLTAKLSVPTLELTRLCETLICTDTHEMPNLEQSVTQIKGIWLKVRDLLCYTKKSAGIIP